MVTKMEYVRVLSSNLKMFFKINKCIFISVRMKAFTMQSKNKIGAWAHMRPPLCLTIMFICIQPQGRIRITPGVNFFFKIIKILSICPFPEVFPFNDILSTFNKM